MRKGLIFVMLAAAALPWPEPAIAGSGDQDAAREAVARGEMRPLAEILGAVRDRLPGQIVGVEIENKKGRWFYEFRVMDGKGHLYEVYVNAQNAEIGRIEVK